ncbi:hypothetical protein VTK26DRAFT_3583 [Humicola hyalothermophila]
MGLENALPESHEFSMLLHSYIEHGNREGLARLAQIWSPAIDEDGLMGDALHRFIFTGDEAAVRIILGAGVSPTVVSCSDPNYTPLLTAADAGHREIARLLWKLVGPEGRSYPKHRTCLQVAAGKGHADLVADLLDIWDGWPMDEKCAALNAAAAQWHDNVVGLLVAKVPYEAGAVQFALELSVTRGPILPVRLFVSREPITTPEVDLRLQRVVCRLIEAGADPDWKAFNNKVPLLHFAALSGHRIGSVKGLLEKGANPNIQDQSGKTVLHQLFRRPLSSKAGAGLRALLDHGASPELVDEAVETGLHAAAHTGTLEHLQLCLAACRDADAAIRRRTSHGESLLHYSAAGGREDIVEFLLSRGLDVNQANANGWTPLVCALMPTSVKRCYPHYSLASLLLRHGASARVVTDEGWTALHGLASYPSANRGLSAEVWEGVAPLVKELISHGAPLETESSVLLGRSVTTRTLTSDDAWGIRMRWFAQKAAASLTSSSASASSARDALVFADRDTAPHMWAYRTGAMEVFETILAHWASVSEAEN